MITWATRWKHLVAVATLLAVAAVASSGSVPAGAQMRLPRAGGMPTVLLLHGFSPTGSCPGAPRSQWSALETSLRNHGWTDIHKLQYYACDDVGGEFIDIDGGHVATTPGHTQSQDGGHLSHSRDASITHLAYHLAWYIHNHYSDSGQDVVIVAYSMGGLIVRLMLSQVSAGVRGYPSPMSVSHVVTLGTPHNGTTSAYFVPTNSVQTLEMRPDSSVIYYLNHDPHGDNPQGTGSTQWTLVGAGGDYVVDSASATHMASISVIEAVYQKPYIGHYTQWDRVGYLEDTSGTRDAEFKTYSDGCSLASGPLTGQPHVGDLTHFGLMVAGQC